MVMEKHLDNDGRLHNFPSKKSKNKCQQPALVLEDGTECYYVDGLLNRDGLPAIVRPCGTKEYYYNGLLHRSGAPAIIKPNGENRYYENGKLLFVITGNNCKC